MDDVMYGRKNNYSRQVRIDQLGDGIRGIFRAQLQEGLNSCSEHSNSQSAFPESFMHAS